MGNSRNYNDLDVYNKYIKAFNLLFINNDNIENDINKEKEYIESDLFEIYEKRCIEEFLTTTFQLGLNAMRNGNFINEDDKYYRECSRCILNHKKSVIKKRKIDDIWIYNNVEVDFINFTAKVNGEYVKLGMTPIKILKLLLEHEGQVLSRSQILDNIWGTSISLCDRTIDVHISNLKKTLMLNSSIKSIRSIGYKFN